MFIHSIHTVSIIATMHLTSEISEKREKMTEETARKKTSSGI